VLIRSRTTSGLHGIGTHLFARPLIEGQRVDFEGETWMVVQVQVDRTPNVAVLELEVSASEGKGLQARGYGPRLGRA